MGWVNNDNPSTDSTFSLVDKVGKRKTFCHFDREVANIAPKYRVQLKVHIFYSLSLKEIQWYTDGISNDHSLNDHSSNDQSSNDRCSNDISSNATYTRMRHNLEQHILEWDIFLKGNKYSKMRNNREIKLKFKVR